MKNSYWKNSASKLRAGVQLVGKWHRNSYKIMRMLGAGATGTVYLATSAEGLVAVKVGHDNLAITSEVNVLKRFSKVQEHSLGPSLFDVDDFVTAEGTLPFYAMEYLKGTQFIDYIQGKGSEWIGLFMVQLLGDLERLHQAGWVFGDLKPDNLLVSGPPAKVRWLDVGGITLFDRSIKEYTEFYDRGYWGLGTRKAEPSYDLFAVAMIMINCAYPKRFDKQSEPSLPLLRKRIESQPMLRPYSQVILSSLKGKYLQAAEMRKAILLAMSGGSSEQNRSLNKVSPTKKQRKRKVKQKPSNFVEVFLVGSFIILVSILYLFGQSM